MHRTLGQQLDLFHFEEHTSGMVFWHPNGWKIFRTIQSYMRDVHENHGYHEVRTPMLLNKSLWETSGHWEKFHENMFTVKEEDGREYALKPMSCPAHIELYDLVLRSYRELPIRYFEFGVVHRNESSGSMHGLMRVRQFTQDDAHIFCLESQILEETKNYIEMVREVYSKFGFEKFDVKLSTRPEKRMGDEKLWDKAEESLSSACAELNIPFDLQPGEGAFYGPKLEFVLYDNIDRAWQCGTIQVDFQLPVRFDLSFVGVDGNKTDRPVILHHAVLGSLERWVGVLLEQTCGVLPPWLSPIQAVVVPISEKSDEYAKEVHSLINGNRRIILDQMENILSAKIGHYSSLKIPYILVVGEKEAKNRTVSVRTLGNNKSETWDLTRLQDVVACGWK